MEYGEFEIESPDLVATISPMHGAVARLRDKFGADWLWRKSIGDPYEPESGGIFPMIPYANRVAGGSFRWRGENIHLPDIGLGQNHALHGDAWMNNWSVVERSEERAVLRHLGIFGPFEYQATQTVRVADSSLTLSIDVAHVGECPVPYGVGFHPWFFRDEDTELWAPAEAMWLENQEHFPTRRAQPPVKLDFSTDSRRVPGEFSNNLFDGWAYDAKVRARISYPNRNAILSVSATPNLRHYMLYVGGPDVFCFEPVSHRVNEINSSEQPGLVTLARDGSLSASMSLSIESPISPR